MIKNGTVWNVELHSETLTLVCNIVSNPIYAKYDKGSIKFQRTDKMNIIAFLKSDLVAACRKHQG